LGYYPFFYVPENLPNGYSTLKDMLGGDPKHPSLVSMNEITAEFPPKTSNNTTVYTEIGASSSNNGNLYQLLASLFRLPISGTWKRFIVKGFMNPFGITDAKMIVCKDLAHLASIRSDNPELNNWKGWMPRVGLPTPISISAVTWPEDGDTKTYLFDSDPISTGMMLIDENLPGFGDGILRAGGRVSTYAFNANTLQSQGPEVNNIQPINGTLQYGWGITDQACTSSFAPGAAIIKSWYIPDSLCSTSNFSTKIMQNTKKFVMDAGVQENTGLAALLRRKVSRAVVYINTADISVNVNGDLKALFGISNEFQTATNSQVFNSNQYNQTIQGLINSRINGLKKNYYPTLYSSFYTVINNSLLGIEPYGQVEVLWVFNAFCDEFFTKLSPSITQQILKISPTFPLIATINPSNTSWLPNIINLSPITVRALALQNCWITENYVNPWIIARL
jgi:hypothetical protein